MPAFQDLATSLSRYIPDVNAKEENDNQRDMVPILKPIPFFQVSFCTILVNKILNSEIPMLLSTGILFIFSVNVFVTMFSGKLFRVIPVT